VNSVTRSYKSEKPRFETTQWSAVLRAAQSDHPRRMEAMEALCRAYWYPIYAFARRRGLSSVDAQDCAQEFFLQMVEGSLFRDLSPAKGRFRSYLLACCEHFLLNLWEKQRAQKRGGHLPHLALDAESEDRFLYLADTHTAEGHFDREWARQLLRRVESLLAQNYQGAGKSKQWEVLSPYLGSTRELPVAELMQKLEVSENNLHVLLHRLRQKYRELLRNEVSLTLDDPADLKDEIRYLLKQLE